MAPKSLSVPLRADPAIPLGGPYAESPEAYEPEDLALWGSFTLDECDAQAALARSSQGRWRPPIRRFPDPTPTEGEVRRAS
jgi:hypothetical protein